MTLEKILKAGILLIALFIGVYMVYSRMGNEKAINEAGRLERLPRFKFPKIAEAGFVSRADLRSGKTVVVYFSPDCEHCQALGADIGMNLTMLRDIDFVFVTRMEEADAIRYAKKCNIWGEKHFYFGLDMDAAFYGYFGEMFIPSAYVFDEKGKLLQILHQNAMVRDILDVYAGKPSDKNKGTR
ncbi:MAG: TlpA family protein disulfide reductase [Bacteroidia bacterium]